MPSDIRLTGSGAVLRELREEAKLGLREAAERLGWDPGLLSKYETNQVGVTLESVESIAELVGRSKEAVVLQCLRSRYESFSKANTPIGKALGELLEKLGVPKKRPLKPRFGGKGQSSRR
jgi:transcriptional regulator with XRE-family HTH domain